MKFLLLSSMLIALTAPVAQAQVRDTAATRLAGGERWRTDFSRRTVPSHEILSGGPSKDGIPAIDYPRFETAAQAGGWLKARDPVMVVEHGGVARAYPLGILVWHEIVNDEVAGLPVAVTFCPLCNTALVFDRRLGDQLLNFGTTGRLRHSDLVMYDRQTESWWQQASGEGIVGQLAGRKLQRVPSTTLAWSSARQLHPRIQVLSRNTGYSRPYGRNPYVGYDNPRGRPLADFFRGKPDPRLPAMERLVAVELGRGWAVPVATLRRVRVVNAEAGNTPFTVFWTPGAASALDRKEIAEGRDVGQSAAFDRRLQGRVLTFRAVRNGFQDRETGSLWDLAGRAVSGPLRGQRLRAVPHDNPFWFAWITFRPQTEVWRP
jgi:hypothetical protein